MQWDMFIMLKRTNLNGVFSMGTHIDMSKKIFLGSEG